MLEIRQSLFLVHDPPLGVRQVPETQEAEPEQSPVSSHVSPAEALALQTPEMQEAPEPEHCWLAEQLSPLGDKQTPVGQEEPGTEQSAGSLESQKPPGEALTLQREEMHESAELAH